MNRRSSLRSRAARPRSTEAVQYKLERIVGRHEQLKVAYRQLRSQMRTGLHETEDVLTSLAMPLMKLVGLKTVEMAAEGRISTVVTSADCFHSQEDNDYMTRAMAAGNEMMERHKLQLIQLVGLLKKIEAQVNSSQNSIFQNLADHQAFMKQFFIKAFAHVSAIRQPGQSNDLSHMMLKILKITFDQVGAALRSVEVGIDDLMCELADKMCNPMVDYVNGLKVEMKTGGLSRRLLEIVKEMDGAIKIGKFELEEARKQARLAEQSRTETLGKLQKSEEMAMKLTKSLGFSIEETLESKENLTRQESSNTEEDQTSKDDNLLWDLLRMKWKWKCQKPDSSLGTKEQSGIETRNKKPKLARSTPLISHRPITNSLSKLSTPKSSLNNSRKMLCSSSPSASTQKVLCRKRITP